MEKKKIYLEELKVNSFVTTVDKNESQTIEGGAPFLTVATPWSTPVCTVTLVSASYTVGKELGQPIATVGKWVTGKILNPGDTFGFVCITLTVT